MIAFGEKIEKKHVSSGWAWLLIAIIGDSSGVQISYRFVGFHYAEFIKVIKKVI